MGAEVGGMGGLGAEIEKKRVRKYYLNFFICCNEM